MGKIFFLEKMSLFVNQYSIDILCDDMACMSLVSYDLQNHL